MLNGIFCTISCRRSTIVAQRLYCPSCQSEMSLRNGLPTGICSALVEFLKKIWTALWQHVEVLSLPQSLKLTIPYLENAPSSMSNKWAANGEFL
ncbi:hypothetical protein ANCCAN_12765, partial [Ancylostoma caninum]